ncbi:MAG: CRISPR-associated RAMP protein Csx7 [Metallosphaera sp.]|uniref:type III CRISPR-associated RAMP protein Csx7 n=1 Tax=Metallosphaera sp. TaxID=2020860 RepID=UPI003168F162
MSSTKRVCYDLDSIRSVYEITGYLVNETRLRIGSGKASSSFMETSDNPIIRRNDKPYIPGSSLKGALRSLLEANVNNLYSEDKYKKVYTQQDIKKAEDNKNLQDLTSCPGSDKVGYFCIPCIIFGYIDVSARMYVFDAEVEGDFKIENYTSVAINRVLGGQNPGSLFTFDYISPGAKFKFKSLIYNVNLEKEDDDWRKQVRKGIIFVLRSLTEGIFIGGRKSVGAGFIKLVQPKIRSYKADKGEWVDMEFKEVINKG